MRIESYADPSTLPPGQSVRVAGLLAIQNPDEVSELQLARHVANGLQPEAVFALGDVIGKNRVIGQIVPEATFRRTLKAGKPLSREHSERLYEIGRVVDAVSLFYHGDQQAIETYLNRPHPLLDEQTPFELATSSSAGAEAVLNLIRRMEASVAV